MGLGRQAKTLSKGQAEATLAYLSTTRYPERNRLIFLLSAKAGLRSKEIACLTWRMTNDASGDIAQAICLFDIASKGKSGRTIPSHPEFRSALIAYRETVNRRMGEYVIVTERPFQLADHPTIYRAGC